MLGLAIGMIPFGVSAKSKEHWAFQPVKEPVVPILKGSAEVGTLLDVHVVAGLEAKKLTLSHEADRLALVRRASMDLRGLHPSFAEAKQFMEDGSPDAWERLIDRFLASSEFGERWGRHWLDVARYADTKGYVFQEERRYPYSYTYRDWVVAAFNGDMPYAEFLRCQIAADLMEEMDRKNLAAMGYLTLGRRFLKREPDIIDDRIDVVTRGMQALTVSCSRCHDHKYDPIPIEDYYSMYGIFASSQEPGEKPLISDASGTAYERFKTELKAREQKIADFHEKKKAQLFETERLREYLQALVDSKDVAGDKRKAFAEKRKIFSRALERWREYFGGFKDDHEVMGAWRALSNGRKLEEVMKGNLPAVLKAMLERSEGDWVQAYAAYLTSDDPKAKEVLRSEKGVAGVPAPEFYRNYQTPDQQTTRRLRRAVEKFRAQSPDAPARAMSMVDKGNPVEPVVFTRGNPSSRGKKSAASVFGDYWWNRTRPIPERERTARDG